MEQKTRQAVESARLQWEAQQRQETSKQCEDAVKRQQELWANERRENQSALERLKRELATVRKEYGVTIEKLKRELSQERKKTRYNLKRQDSRSDAPQVTCTTTFLLWLLPLCLVQLYDWFMKLMPISANNLFPQPVRGRRKPILIMYAFSRLAPTRCFCFEFLLVIGNY